VALEEVDLPSDLFMDLDRSSPVPMYHQVSVRLERAIRDEILPAGSRLENEVALSERLGLSRPTIRQAMQQLVDKGLLVRRRGIGTQVVHGKVTRAVELTSLFEDLQSSGQNPRTDLLHAEEESADQEDAEALGVPFGSPVLKLRRLRFADEVPIAIMQNTLPEEFLNLDRGLLSTYGLYQVLSTRGVTMRVAKQRFGARAANADESRLLGITKGSAVLTMARTAFDDSGHAVEFGRHCYRPDLYSFEVTLVAR
jgi:DNA-binding GntR family transcriptional regulator